MANFLVNEGPKYFVLLLWIGVNAILFIVAYMKYDRDKEYVYLKTMMKESLPIARGSAMVLHFNCFLVLIPVCRNLISSLRSSLTCLPQNVLRLLDKSITFHKCVAYMICIATAVHIGAHMYNIERLVNSWKQSGLVGYLNHLSDGNGTTFINFVRTADADQSTEALKTVAGVSGIVITLVLILMVTSATEFIRRSYYEVFWFTHHLFVIFYIGYIVHGLQGIVRGQTNTDEHDPEMCSKQDWSGRPPPCSSPQPQFDSGGASGWKWVIAPLVVYFIERCIRFYRSLQKVEIVKVINHPSRVLELRMKRRNFHADPGQYIFIQCPNISKLEWHPFTLTSCPEEEFFSVHIRLVGDWTEALGKLCGLDEQARVDTSNLPKLSVDGPFGTASTDVFNYPVCMFVGAGIGVTPFASIMKSIWYQHQKENNNLTIRKVYFFWICPDTNAFEWFADLLQQLETQMLNKGMRDFLEYNIYLTKGWGKHEARNIVLHERETIDVITGLQQKTNFGRPNWDQIFTTIAAAHAQTKVGVFFCGPSGLSHTLHRMCNSHSEEKDGVRFYYNKENF